MSSYVSRRSNYQYTRRPRYAYNYTVRRIINRSVALSARRRYFRRSIRYNRRA